MRKWLVRGLVLAFLAVVGAVVGGYCYLTRSEAIRRQVVDKVEAIFTGASVRLGAAHWRLFGGIVATDVRFARKDDPTQNTFSHLPYSVVYPDRERLLHGEIDIVKIELFQPQLRIVRDKHGHWNLSGILGDLRPDTPIPTILIHDATMIVEDRLGVVTPRQWEITGVEMTVVNDPLPVLSFELAGRSELAPILKLHASWQRVEHVFKTQIELPRVPLQPALFEQLAAYCSHLTEPGEEIQGAVDIRADLDFDPQREPAWCQQLQLKLHDGRLVHSQLPWPLEKIEAEVSFQPGHATLEHLNAEASGAQLQMSGAMYLPPGVCLKQADFHADLHVQNLPLTKELFARLPDRFQVIQKDYEPDGMVTVNAQLSRTAGKLRQHAEVRPQGLRARFYLFPCLLESVCGTLVHDQEGEQPRLQIDLTARAAESTVLIKGHIVSQGEIHIGIEGHNAVLSDEIRQALINKTYQDLARAFNVRGLADFNVTVRRATGEDRCCNHFRIRFHDAAVCYDPFFPYPLEQVHGELEIGPGGWEFHDFEGRHLNGVVRASGQSLPAQNGQRVALKIQGKNLPLDDELVNAMPPKLQAAWKAFAPAGQLSFDAAVDNSPGQPQDIDVTVNVQGCTLRPTFFPYTLEDVGGIIRYANQKVDIGPITARHGDTVVGLLHGEVYLKQQGGFYAKIDELACKPLLLDRDFLVALPASMQRLGQTLQLHDPITMSTQLIIDMPGEPGLAPTIYWDGGVALNDATLRLGLPVEHVTGQVFCRGRHNGQRLQGVVGNMLLDQLVIKKQPIQQVHTHFEVPRDNPEVVQLPNLKARLFDGDVGGEVRLEFGPTLRYDVNLTLLGMALEKFGRHNLGDKAELQGQAHARLYLTGRGTDLNALDGRGSIDVPHGRMYNLPLLLDLLKVIGLRWPDRTAFEEAHSTFRIHGPRAQVEKLDLFGHAVSLSGQGEMNIDGSDLQLDFYAVWGRITEILPPILDKIPPALGKCLLKVEMRGHLGDVKFNKEAVPVLVEPVERLVKRFMKQPPEKDGNETPRSKFSWMKN